MKKYQIIIGLLFLMGLILPSLVVGSSNPAVFRDSRDIPSLTNNESIAGESVEPVKHEIALTAADESAGFLEEINDRLNSGENPETTVNTFVYWSTGDLKPDFPSWVTVNHEFDLLPLISVSTSLEDATGLVDLHHVAKVTLARQAVYSIASEYLADPYTGSFPLLMNETSELVDATGNGIDGSGVIIAILSTGINNDHPMIDDFDDDSLTDDPKIIGEFDAYELVIGDGGDETDDLDGRGTALASIVAGTNATGGQYRGTLTKTFPFPYQTPHVYETIVLDGVISVGSQAGIAPGAALFDVKITSDDGGLSDESAAIGGIEWAVEHGADVILLDVMNFGPTESTILDAIEMANAHGCLVVVPAGDHDPDGNYDDDTIAPYYTINSPASAPAALTVGAITETSAMWLESERGPVSGNELSKPDVVAPGVFMLAAAHNYAAHEDDEQWDGDDGDDTLYYDIFTSTSMAAAVAAGAAARLLESYPGASANAIKIALRQGAQDLGFNEMAQGKGLLSLTGAETVLQAADTLPGNSMEDIYTNPDTAVTASALIINEDFIGTKILFDTSYTYGTSTGLADRSWKDETDGDTTKGGFADWQFPYDDTLAPGSTTWYNATYPGAGRVGISITNLTIEDGDFLQIYSSSGFVPDPTASSILPGDLTGNITSLVEYDSSGGHDTLYFAFTTEGDHLAVGEEVFGVYATIRLFFNVRTTPITGFEFDDLVDHLGNDLGAEIDYWNPDSANGPPTATILDYYDLFVLPQPRASLNNFYQAFGQTNETGYYELLDPVLSDYQGSGGNILFIGDEDHAYYNYATSSFGIDWLYGGVGGPTDSFVDHPITTTPYPLEEVLIGAPYTYFSGGTPVIYDGNVPTVVYHEGTGKAVFVADEDVFNDELWTATTDPFSTDPHFYNNTQLAMNIIYWLTGVTHLSGPVADDKETIEVISYSAPKTMISGASWEVSATVQNTGNHTTSAILAYGMDWSVPAAATNIGDPAQSGGGATITSDNANSTWHFDPDDDVDVSLNATTIEFYYNISSSYPISQVGLPYIVLSATGTDRSSGECQLSLNGVNLGPIYETGGTCYYPIYPVGILEQLNNEIRITVPFDVNLTLSSFAIFGWNFTDSDELGVTHVQTASLSPGQQQQIDFTITPTVNTVTAFEPFIKVMLRNMTHAYLVKAPGDPALSDLQGVEVAIYYGNRFFDPDDADEYDAPSSMPVAIPKNAREGPLPLLYDITPDSLDFSSSTKIVRFPGDLRVDGLTVMSSAPVENSFLTLSGSITGLVGFGNFSEAYGFFGSGGLAGFSYDGIAPHTFYADSAMMGTTSLALGSFNNTYIEPVLQTVVPKTLSPGQYTGELNLLSNGTTVFTVPLALTIETPVASFLLYDAPPLYDVSNADERNYDKLWDQLYEVWKIAAEAGYDIDSFAQSYILELFWMNHDLTKYDLDDFISQYISDVPPEEDLPYAGLIGAELDVTLAGASTAPDKFIARGGSLIQLGTGGTATARHMGPNFSGDISYIASDNKIATIADEAGSNNPLLDDVDSLLYLGGGYILVDQITQEQQLNYDVISGISWMYGNITHDLAVIYHDAISPIEFSYDTGKYEQDTLDQAYKGLKIIVGTNVISQSWFLEQVDIWAYFATQYSAENDWIPSNVERDWGNRQFIENIFHVAANKAPEIEGISVTPEHVVPGEVVTIEVNVSDDQTPESELVVLIPEKLEADFLYVRLAYINGSFRGSFPIADISRLDTYNIAVFDSLYRLNMARDDYKHLIPQLNQRPMAELNMAQYTENQNFFITNVQKGDLISMEVRFWDAEDGLAVNCIVGVYRVINAAEMELIYAQEYVGTGTGMFFVDTTGFSGGTYVIIASVEDTDGGEASYTLAAFNIGSGTLYKPPPAAGADIIPVVIGGSAVLGGAGILGGGGYLLFTNKGGSMDYLRKLLGRGGDDS